MTEAEAIAQGFTTAPIRTHGFYDFLDIASGAIVTRWCYPDDAGRVTYLMHRKGQPLVKLGPGWMWRGPVQAPEGVH